MVIAGDGVVRVFRCGQLIDGISEEPVRSVNLIVEHGRIKEVTRDASAEPSHYDEVDLRGLTVLPGLVNAHVHLGIDDVPDPVAQALSDDESSCTLRCLINAQRWLLSGVTMVRDLGCRYRSPLALSFAQQEGRIPAPRIVGAGRAIATTGGHGGHVNEEADGPESVMAAVRRQIKQGALTVKLMVTGGAASGNTTAVHMTEQEIAAAVSVGRDRGVGVAVHAVNPEGVKRAARAGVHTVEHGAALDAGCVELMRANDIVLVPTLCVYQQMATHPGNHSLPGSLVRNSRELVPTHSASVRKAYAAGIPVAVGTDAGSPFNPHGDIVTEMILVREVTGMSSMQVVQAATRTGALACGKLSDVGTLEVGKCADFIAVEGEVLDDLNVLRTPKCVVMAGRVVVNEGRLVA